MIFEEIKDGKLDDGELLWRYIDLHKFISIISGKKLFFSRLDQFEDPFEGVAMKLIADRDMAKRTPPLEKINPAIPKNHRENISRSREDKIRNYERESLIQQKSQFVNCWILSERESMAMWNIYSNKSSIAIQFEGKNLVEYFENHVQFFEPEYYFICGRVIYRKINPPDYFEKKKERMYSAFKKDVAFEFEKEYRFLISTPISKVQSNPSFFKIELSEQLMESMKVICHPQMEDWKFNNIQTLCKEFKISKPERSKIELK